MTDEMDILDKKFQKELLGGITSLVLLEVLDKSGQAMYGYQIAKMIEGEEKDAAGKQGVLYPVLRSLESSGLLSSMVEPSVSGPPRRYYRITEAGRESLVRWLKIWRKTRDYVDRVAQVKN